MDGRVGTGEETGAARALLGFHDARQDDAPEHVFVGFFHICQQKPQIILQFLEKQYITRWKYHSPYKTLQKSVNTYAVFRFFQQIDFGNELVD